MANDFQVYKIMPQGLESKKIGVMKNRHMNKGQNTTTTPHILVIHAPMSANAKTTHVNKY